jgi:hypothetical protein
MSVLRFDATVIGVIAGKAVLVRNDAPKVQVVIPTQSAEEDKALAALMFQRVTITMDQAVQPTAAGRRRA